MTSLSGGRRAAWLATYAVAMGLLESAVVVYLRQLYYPNGFGFPLVAFSPWLAYVEIGRELCTVVMLVAVAVLAAQDRLDGFYVFGFLFGVWDLVYYAGLKLVVGWPDSLWTWDVLFLIPVPWVAPVLAPVLIALLLVAGFVTHTLVRRRLRCIRPRATEWGVAVAAGVVIVVALCWRFRSAFTDTKMSGFPWWLYAAGVLLGVAPFVRATARGLR